MGRVLKTIKTYNMPLFTGTWKININGSEGDLNITSLGADGFINGTVLNIPFRGFWNESSQMIFFESITTVVVSGGGPFGNDATASGAISRAQFTGYLFSTPPLPNAGADLKWTLSGHVTTAPTDGFVAVQPNSHRITFGWFAQVTQVI